MRSSTRQMCLMEAQQICSLLEWLLGRRAHLPINWHIQAHTTFSPRQKSEALSVPSVWLCFAFFWGGIMGCKTWEWRFQSPRLPPHICQGHPKQCIEKTKVLRSLSSGMWDLKRKSHKTWSELCAPGRHPMAHMHVSVQQMKNYMQKACWTTSSYYEILQLALNIWC